jgi:hypothetical protein
MKPDDMEDTLWMWDVPTEIQFKKSKDCEHDWKDYIGLKEMYKYCSKCGKKYEKEK